MVAVSNDPDYYKWQTQYLIQEVLKKPKGWFSETDELALEVALKSRGIKIEDVWKDKGNMMADIRDKYLRIGKREKGEK